jgi:NTP pyrophosphatase (non-canonical NTP hydrolase)
MLYLLTAIQILKQTRLNMDRLTKIVYEIVQFRDRRDWKQFHSPRNLATAVGIEVAELQELLLWKSDKEVDSFLAKEENKKEFAKEIADILIFTVLLCHQTGIDPIEAMRSKLNENAKKYPVDLSKGKATKYNRRK